MFKAKFLKWAHKAAIILENQGYSWSLKSVGEHSAEKCAYLDADSDATILKIVGWDNGEVGVDAINASTGEIIIIERPDKNLSYEEVLNFYFEKLVNSKN